MQNSSVYDKQLLITISHHFSYRTTRRIQLQTTTHCVEEEKAAIEANRNKKLKMNSKCLIFLMTTVLVVVMTRAEIRNKGNEYSDFILLSR
jgi:hypothetical protein